MPVICELCAHVNAILVIISYQQWTPFADGVTVFDKFQGFGNLG